jgi:hypothetical protein
MKIILTAIVGNEEAVIARFIESFSHVADKFVFVQAIGNKSPDKTKEIIAATCKKPYVFDFYRNDDFPHVDNFGAARQKALEIAINQSAPLFGNGAFIIWADADDIISKESAEKIRAACNDDAPEVIILPYHVKGDKQIVMRERIIRSTLGTKWAYAIHEQMQFDHDVTYRIIDAPIIHAPLTDKTSSHNRNVAILEKELANTWRNLFYLSQEYFQTGQTKKFLTTCNIALQIPDIGDIEKYELLLQLAQLDSTRSKQAAAEAFALMPDRREAIALLCNYALIDGDDKKALQMAELMIGTPHPSVTYWSQNNEWYGWKAEELYRQCLRLNGEVEEATYQTSSAINPDLPLFSIIHATLDRPLQALAIRELWLSRAKHPENVQYIFGLHDFDKRSKRVLGGFEHTVTKKKGSAENYDLAAGLAIGQVIVQAQDDCYPPQDWDVELSKLIPDINAPAFVAVSDGHRTDRLCVNTVMTSAYMKLKAGRETGENGFFYRGYVTVFPDTENSYRAIKDAENGLIEYIDAPQFVIYHDHPMFNPAVPMDSTYEWENSPDNYKQGRALFMDRNPEAKDNDLKRKELVTA